MNEQFLRNNFLDYAYFYEPDNDNHYCKLNFESIEERDKAYDIININGEKKNLSIVYTGCNLIDMLGFIYDPYLKSLTKETLTNKKFSSDSFLSYYIKNFVFGFYEKEYECPDLYKSISSDAGWDISITKKIWEKNNIAMYDTGIKIDIPYPHHLKVYPRSSLGKSGYIIGNSVGIIDCGYRGSIKIILIKVDSNAEELTLPKKVAQLILDTGNVFFIKDKVTEKTKRNIGGFGSTNC